MTNISFSVLDVVMGIEAEFASNQEFGFDKKRMTEPSSILSFIAATWEFCGGRYLIILLVTRCLCYICPHG